MKNVYLERYAYPNALIITKPTQNVELIVTIPCYNESSLLACLESLNSCAISSEIAVEVIVLINEPENATDDVTATNKRCFQEAIEWVEKQSSEQINFHIRYRRLPKKHAGVGLARKIIMDEAVRRFDLLNKPNGIILCYDADCTCEQNYLQEVYQFFNDHPDCPGASIYFEHPLKGEQAPAVYEAIIDYELFLRYYVNALRYAKYPYAFETIGSSMAVQSNAYQKQGGMNKRKAGEDFYFLHKIIPLGNFGEINSTCVMPSPRQSDRVPFGTGRAVNKWLVSQKLETYAIESFSDLAVFIQAVPNIFKNDLSEVISNLPTSFKQFIAVFKLTSEIEKIRNNTASEEKFLKQFYQWFDGFKVLKFIHYARDEFYPNQPVRQLAQQLLLLTDGNHEKELDTKSLLMAYRKLDREY